ncbi:hypothetical protein Acr_09g0005700 [Actinidia rufa]|uniref:Uncharacterized protein n=1 Tax=Actinidia rufa TaxID=165716 RepID=A0A7J0F600_9ERIC|nr:hypothetical protein Acr_09g0005700 [Actinidia rufa]
MKEINGHLVKHLATNNPPLAIAPVPEEVDRSRVGSTDQQACTLGEEGVLSYQSLGHLAELRTRLVIRPRDVGDHLIEMIELMGVATNALIRQTKPPFTERLMRVKSLVQIQVAISARSVRREDRSHGPPRLVQELDDAPGVLMEIKNEDFVKWPENIKTNPLKRNKNKYYEFHKDHGHNTEDCFQLNYQIADLMKRGYLRKFVADRPWNDFLDRGYVDNRIRRRINKSARVDQVAFDLRGETPPDYDLAGFHHYGLSFSLQCNPRSPNPGKDRGYYFYLPPDDEVSYFNWDKRDDAEMEALRDEVEDAPLVDPREMENTKPLEEVASISIHPDYPNCHIMIRTELTKELRNTLPIYLCLISMPKGFVAASPLPVTFVLLPGC